MVRSAGNATSAAIARVARGVARRIYDRRTYLLWRAGPLAVAPPPPTGARLLRVSAAQPAGHALVAAAMHQAGEPPVVAARLAHGDACFAWVGDDQVLSFGWACFRDREVGLYRYPEQPGQAFLYNFVTAPAQRGRGLYPALLLAMRHGLGADGCDRFEIDVRADNAASVHGIRKAGFAPAGQIGCAIWLGRYPRPAMPRAEWP